MPDPFVLALGLTVFVMALGAIKLALGDTTPKDGIAWTILSGWATTFSATPLLAFALQMCLVLVTGHALALSPPVQRMVRAIAQMPKSSGSAALLVAATACVAAVIHWGLGAIVGAFLAREIGRHAPARGLKLHYPLLGAAAYAGLAVWHGGLSGSAPLKVAEKGHFAENIVGVLPMSDTVFSQLNLIILGVLLVAIPLLFRAMTPSDEAEFIAPDPDQLAPLPLRDEQPVDSIPTWLQERRVVGWVSGGAGLAVVVVALATKRRDLDINSVNMAFLFLGLACQGSLRHYMAAVADGARGAGAIIVQFPFYFGILGIMKAAGMIQWISDWFVDVSSEASFPVFAYLSAGAVNLLVPSGGGQWTVQGEMLLSAGETLKVDPGTTIIAFSYGDAWTNMLQPFWALPLLGIMGLKAKDIIGYTAVVFLMMAVVVPVLLVTLG